MDTNWVLTLFEEVSQQVAVHLRESDQYNSMEGQGAKTHSGMLFHGLACVPAKVPKP